MSKNTYVGSPHNATTEWKIELNTETEKYYIAVPTPCECGCPKCEGVVYRPHTRGLEFIEADEAEEWVQGVQGFLDDDYEDYVNENSYAIRQSELYEIFRNEY